MAGVSAPAVVIIIVGIGNPVGNQSDDCGADQCCARIHNLSWTTLCVVGGGATTDERGDKKVEKEPFHDFPQTDSRLVHSPVDPGP